MAENCPARANQQLRKGKTIEQIYQKKTQLEHILLRPDTYVGSTEHQLQEMWVFDEAKGRMVFRKIDFVPALYKIFDEILVNAADNSKRDAKMDLIDVTIDRQLNCITVMNNGSGIPVQIHKEHKCYVPELIFGHLLTSDNYDDNEKKVTGGRNGYGAKLTNVFSKKFVIETVDKSNKKKFTQVFTKNMTQKDAPVVTDCKSQSEYTKVTFFPDFPRFGMNGLDRWGLTAEMCDNDICSLMMKRVYDIAASTSKQIKVVLNGKQLSIRSFEDYVRFFLQSATDGSGSETQRGFKLKFVFEQIGGRCKLVVEDSCRRCTSEEIAESYRLKWSRLLAEKEARRGTLAGKLFKPDRWNAISTEGKLEACTDFLGIAQVQERRCESLSTTLLVTVEHEGLKGDPENYLPLNAAKFTYCGFVRSYPLHEAAKEMNWRVMVCLMKFGANPSQKDSRNKRAIDYVPVECLEALTLESLTT
eukprot:symbB.v1.2.006138.t1/scaffold349.1/size309019/2